ncbi:MAG: insulinase family protein, partial [Flavobacteriaceae bacterium]|nr:insulinase family protein [Flavobacteriaceae bacterium]
PRMTNGYTRNLFKNDKVDHKVMKKEISQSLCAIGRTSYSISDERRLPFFLLTNILGGPAMNSRLNLSLRERKGFVYSIEANYSPFIDTGIFSIQFGTENNNLKKSIDTIYKELKYFREKKLSTKQIQDAREQLKGQLAIAEENNTGFMLMMGKSLLDLGKIEPLDDIFHQIDNIDASDLLALANEMFEEDTLSTLIFSPK